MKLYRGLKTKEYIPFNKELLEKQKTGWRKLLIKREKGDFSFPNNLNGEAINLNNLKRLNLQNFTDNKETALRYAKLNKGILIELDVSIEDILKYFSLEFQNFPKRREKFEIVYVIDNETLTNKSKEWNLKINSLKYFT